MLEGAKMHPRGKDQVTQVWIVAGIFEISAHKGLIFFERYGFSLPLSRLASPNNPVTRTRLL